MARGKTHFLETRQNQYPTIQPARPPGRIDPNPLSQWRTRRINGRNRNPCYKISSKIKVSFRQSTRRSQLNTSLFFDSGNTSNVRIPHRSRLHGRSPRTGKCLLQRPNPARRREFPRLRMAPSNPARPSHGPREIGVRCGEQRSWQAHRLWEKPVAGRAGSSHVPSVPGDRRTTNSQSMFFKRDPVPRAT